MSAEQKAMSAPHTAVTLALVIDDSPFLGLHLARLLAAQGIAARVPADAAEVRALAPAADLIFVELQQFEANGFEVTRELAAQVSCPLVLLSGTGRSTDLQWAQRAGACAVLQRPITAEKLEALLQVLHVMAQAPSARSSPIPLMESLPLPSTRHAASAERNQG